MTDPKTLKNDAERKAWLKDYRSWGLWYKDENIGVSYYKYDFEDGARLIVQEFIEPGNKYIKEHPMGYFHLLNAPDKHSGWYSHDRFMFHPDSETLLLSFLKETKGGTL